MVIPKIKVRPGLRGTSFGGLVNVGPRDPSAFSFRGGLEIQGFEELIDEFNKFEDQFDKDVAVIVGPRIEFELPPPGSRSNNTRGMDWAIEFGHSMPNKKGRTEIPASPYVRPAFQKLENNKMQRIMRKTLDNDGGVEQMIEMAAEWLASEMKRNLLRDSGAHSFDDTNPLVQSIGWKKVEGQQARNAVTLEEAGKLAGT